MKPEEQLKALAEVDGWTNLRFQDGHWFGIHSSQLDQKEIMVRPAVFSGIYDHPGCSYLTSYDAIIPLIQKQGVLIRAKCVEHLLVLAGWPKDKCFCIDSQILMLMFSPPQFSEALLRATGKWKE